MNDDTRIFESGYEVYTDEPDGDFALTDEYAQDGYEYQEYEMYGDAYAEETAYEGDPYGEYDQEDYQIYDDALEHESRGRMNLFDAAGVLVGLIVIFVLTALIITLISWIRTDITHSFVILQSNIQ